MKYQGFAMNFGVTKDQYIKATKKPHSVLCIDKPMKRVKRNF